MNCDGREWINVVVGMVFIGLGLLFLVAQLFNVNVVHFTWPFFIIIPGLLFFVGMMLGGKGAGGLAIPGSFITTIGLIMLYQNSFYHWQSWAYAWALVFPTSIGFGLMVMGSWSSDHRTYRIGRRMLGWGLTIFISGMVFFEFVLNISGFGNNPVGKMAGPAILIALGIYLIARRTTIVAKGQDATPAAEYQTQASQTADEKLDLEPVEGDQASSLTDATQPTPQP